jgi:hypothetical protein
MPQRSSKKIVNLHNVIDAWQPQGDFCARIVGAWRAVFLRRHAPRTTRANLAVAKKSRA